MILHQHVDLLESRHFWR